MTKKKPVVNTQLMRNPYVALARRVIDTHEQRTKDIDLLKRDLKAVKDGTKATRHLAFLPDMVTGTDGENEIVGKDAIIDALAQRIEDLQLYVDIVENALEVATISINDKKVRREAKNALIRYSKSSRYSTNPSACGYPIQLSKYDFDTRRRKLYKQVIRDMGLMPYSSHITDDPRR